MRWWQHAPLRVAAALAILASPSVASAGLHYSGEQFAELPSRPSGFLLDHRALRAAGYDRPDGLPSPLRADYTASADRLQKLAKTRALTADESADLGAVLIRLGKPADALNVLVPAARKAPEHFRLAANLGTAFHLTGDLDKAATQLEEAVRLAPAKLKPFEKAHLALVKRRAKEPKSATGPTRPDDLFGVTYKGDAGSLPEAELKKLPDDAVAIVQQLALWLPADGRLLWQFGELCNAFGDARAAANCLDGCVTEFALAAPDLRARRLLFRAAVEEQAKKPDHDKHRSALKVKSTRPLVKAFDESLLPAIAADKPNPLPWPVLAATTIGKGKPQFAKYLDKLDGKTVTLTGFMQPTKDANEQSEFLLLEYPIGCWFCEQPDPLGLISVELKADTTVEYRRGLVKVTGTLTLNRDNPEAYLFELKGARVGEAD